MALQQTFNQQQQNSLTSLLHNSGFQGEKLQTEQITWLLQYVPADKMYSAIGLIKFFGIAKGWPLLQQNYQKDIFKWPSMLKAEINYALRKLPPGVDVTSGHYQCKKCKSSKTIATMAQTRSADEPATVFIRCQSAGCGFMWTL